MPVKNRLNALMGEMQTRENRAITQAEVAEGTGLTRAAINKWKKGRITQFNSDTVERLCKFFNCDVGDLLYVEFEEEPTR